jgi:hypothetical protein
MWTRRQRVGSGLVEVTLLMVLTIVVLPCCFFTLLALLDRFERSLANDTQIAPAPIVKPTPIAVVIAALTPERVRAPEPVMADDETAGGDVVPLPIAVTVAQSPAAATG